MMLTPVEQSLKREKKTKFSWKQQSLQPLTFFWWRKWGDLSCSSPSNFSLHNRPKNSSCHSKEIANNCYVYSRSTREKFSWRTSIDVIHASTNYLDTWRVFCTKRCLIQMQTRYPFLFQIVTASDGMSTSRTISAVIGVHSLRTRLLWTVYTKNGIRTLLKTYDVIFLCFSTKAVHIEPVMSLTKDDCLAAIKRFVSRRGIPDEIYRDNSTTFIWTKGELEFRQALATQEFEDLISAFGKENNIIWLFIPTRTPKFGRLWEAAVKSLKHHLYRNIGGTKLVYVDFTTLLTQIEAILISRPITSVSNDANDALALTTGHCLIWRPITALPEPKTTGNETISLTRQKKRMDNLIRDFWKKWLTEYLSNLQQRKKSQTGEPDIDNNAFVIIREENTPPTLWLMGRITKVFFRKDKIVRVF